jgi:hypothetical protein
MVTAYLVKHSYFERQLLQGSKRENLHKERDQISGNKDTQALDLFQAKIAGRGMNIGAETLRKINYLEVATLYRRRIAM